MGKEFCLPAELRKAIVDELDKQGVDAEACDRVMRCVDSWAEPCPTGESEPPPPAPPVAGGGTTL